jgi:cytochrome c551/c552
MDEVPAASWASAGSAARPNAIATAAASGFCFNILTLLIGYPRAGVSLPRA